MSWTEDERVEKGTLFVVTYKGGSVGSKGQHEVRVNKLHFKGFVWQFEGGGGQDYAHSIHCNKPEARQVLF